MAIKMSLLTELLRYLDAYGYKDVAPNGAGPVFGRLWL